MPFDPPERARDGVLLPKRVGPSLPATPLARQTEGYEFHRVGVGILILSPGRIGTRMPGFRALTLASVTPKNHSMPASVSPTLDPFPEGAGPAPRTV